MRSQTGLKSAAGPAEQNVAVVTESQDGGNMYIPEQNVAVGPESLDDSYTSYFRRLWQGTVGCVRCHYMYCSYNWLHHVCIAP